MEERKKIRVGFIGSRGIPAMYGGFETFVDKVAVGLAALPDFEVYVVGDPDQKKHFEGMTEYKGVKLLYTNYYKSSSPNRYYYDSAKKLKPYADLLYACGVGGAYSIWISRLQKKIYFTNPDGIGWRRDKFSRIKKTLLWSMFYVAYKHSTYIVPDSTAIGDFFGDKFRRKRKTSVIEYGGELNDCLEPSAENQEVLDKYGLQKDAYHLVVARLEPENKVHMIVDGYLKSTDREHPLVVVGNKLDNAYVKNLLKSESEKVRFVGGIYGGNDLKIVRANAVSYFHGHTVGGTNPSLLEAMGSKNLCICHDNGFNREVTGGHGMFFQNPDDVHNFVNQVEDPANDQKHAELRQNVYDRVVNHYSWERIISMYEKLFRSV